MKSRYLCKKKKVAFWNLGFYIIADIAGKSYLGSFPSLSANVSSNWQRPREADIITVSLSIEEIAAQRSWVWTEDEGAASSIYLQIITANAYCLGQLGLL